MNLAMNCSIELPILKESQKIRNNYSYYKCFRIIAMIIYIESTNNFKIIQEGIRGYFVQDKVSFFYDKINDYFVHNILQKSITLSNIKIRINISSLVKEVQKIMKLVHIIQFFDRKVILYY